MELRFLGRAYATTDNSIPTVAVPQTARFLGRSYTLRRPAANVRLKSQLNLRKYRGVAYQSQPNERN